MRGQLLNYSDLAKGTGMSAATMRQWISVLEASGLTVLLPPWFGNVGKRPAKSPRLYFCDNGLLCHLLNITDEGAFFTIRPGAGCGRTSSAPSF